MTAPPTNATTSTTTSMMNVAVLHATVSLTGPDVKTIMGQYEDQSPVGATCAQIATDGDDTNSFTGSLQSEAPFFDVPGYNRTVTVDGQALIIQFQAGPYKGPGTYRILDGGRFFYGNDPDDTQWDVSDDIPGLNRSADGIIVNADGSGSMTFNSELYYNDVYNPDSAITLIVRWTCTYQQPLPTTRD